MNEKALKNRRNSRLGCLYTILIALISLIAVVYYFTKPVGKDIFPNAGRESVLNDNTILSVSRVKPKEIQIYYPQQDSYTTYKVDREVHSILMYNEKEKLVFFQEFKTLEIRSVELKRVNNEVLVSTLVDKSDKIIETRDRNSPLSGSGRLFYLNDYDNQRFTIGQYYSNKSGVVPLESDWSSSQSAAISPDEKYLTVVQNNQRLLRETSYDVEWITLPGKDHKAAKFIDVDTLVYVTYHGVYYYSISKKGISKQFQLDSSYDFSYYMEILVCDGNTYFAFKRNRLYIDIYNADLTDYKVLKTYNFFPPWYSDIQEYRLYGDDLVVRHGGGFVRKYDFPF